MQLVSHHWLTDQAIKSVSGARIAASGRRSDVISERTSCCQTNATKRSTGKPIQQIASRPRRISVPLIARWGAAMTEPVKRASPSPEAAVGGGSGLHLDLRQLAMWTVRRRSSERTSSLRSALPMVNPLIEVRLGASLTRAGRPSKIETRPTPPTLLLPSSGLRALPA